MMVFVGAAVPGPTTRRRQITHTDTIAAVLDTRMRSLHSGLGTAGTFRYVRCDACQTACPDSARLLAARDLDENFLAPRIGVGPDRQHIPHGLGGFRVVEFGFSAHRTSLNLDLQLHRLLPQSALAYRVYPSRDSGTSRCRPFCPAPQQ